VAPIPKRGLLFPAFARSALTTCAPARIPSAQQLEIVSPLHLYFNGDLIVNKQQVAP